MTSLQETKLGPVGFQLDDATDIAVFVRSSDDDLKGWNRQRIVDALLRETMIDKDTADLVGQEVETFIRKTKIKFVSAPLIRELVNAKLIELGLEKERRMHTRLGMPVHDVKQLIMQQNKENANIPHGPEATNLTLAENIKKEFAFLNVFNQEVGDAHMAGDIHLHDLGFIDRPYCSGQSLEYIKKFGLSLPNALSLAKPARHAEVLLAHMVKFAAALQSNFAGAIGWDAVNLFFAPYLVELDDRQVKQLAQMLVFEFSQQAVARGGQAIFSDINLYWEVPDHFVDVNAIGPGGEYVENEDPATREEKPYLTYGDFEKQAQRFIWAIFQTYLEGDGAGRPFFFPKPLVHITEKFFKTPGHEEFLKLICQVASEKGNTYFVFDRGNTAKISECCRLSFKLDESDLEDAKTPWRMRYSAIQNVTINLPRLAYRAAGDDTKLMALLREQIELAVEAHLSKRAFIEQLLAAGANGPLSLLCMDHDGQGYLRMQRGSYLIGMVGLNEMIQYHIGAQLHESDEAIRFGLKIIANMKIVADKYRQQHGMHFVLEQTPAESTAYRFAKLDLEQFSEQAKDVIKGDLETNEIYYTNSTLFNIGAEMNPVERIKLEGLFHPLIEAGAITHIWLGEAQPSAESLANFVTKTFRWTKNDQVAFSPEFTSCRKCYRTARGLLDECPYCGSTDLEGITRITGYFTKLSSWNKGKLGELKDRYRNQAVFAKPASTNPAETATG
ncbi:MAG: anaerobic ribonucleoside-triphosphate reductase [Deltaproteobacteria bacterium]|nr:anaerobic ribonucleoside-triphosphate reductase [Deltaproteobacteria bacterium]MBW2051789.1 anaerobic ribonucleoside-triphosphate reductase [Deltaproteobacteria bacterium]MBW2140635.1 anaerobic ribonucleoside-triphosphate reductase [Deltaproteobacteria bacterium]MBW2323303.1 anaerobic ribonucleoside-triphosphate reductase [Deltaproteobacteria bacterium]